MSPEATQRGLRYTYPPLADERDEAARVKQARPILVVLGNPPYNAFAGTSPAEESGLVEPYKAGLQRDWGIRKFNLDDLYVRFFRVAERRIAEGTGRGVVCFITNHSWLWYPSYVVMRERLLGEFNCVWIDNLNGSKFETGKVAPDGSPDPSVFSTASNREGIQVGTAVALLVRRADATEREVLFRDLWGTAKREVLLNGLRDASPDDAYVRTVPTAANRFSLRRSEIANDYASWPSLPRLPSLHRLSAAPFRSPLILPAYDCTRQIFWTCPTAHGSTKRETNVKLPCLGGETSRNGAANRANGTGSYSI